MPLDLRILVVCAIHSGKTGPKEAVTKQMDRRTVMALCAECVKDAQAMRMKHGEDLFNSLKDRGSPAPGVDNPPTPG